MIPKKPQKGSIIRIEILVPDGVHKGTKVEIELSIKQIGVMNTSTEGMSMSTFMEKQQVRPLCSGDCNGRFKASCQQDSSFKLEMPAKPQNGSLIRIEIRVPVDVPKGTIMEIEVPIRKIDEGSMIKIEAPVQMMGAQAKWYS